MCVDRRVDLGSPFFFLVAAALVGCESGGYGGESYALPLESAFESEFQQAHC